MRPLRSSARSTQPADTQPRLHFDRCKVQDNVKSSVQVQTTWKAHNAECKQQVQLTSAERTRSISPSHQDFRTSANLEILQYIHFEDDALCPLLEAVLQQLGGGRFKLTFVVTQDLAGGRSRHGGTQEGVAHSVLRNVPPQGGPIKTLGWSHPPHVGLQHAL
jgi:hypothetical protein